MAESKVIQLTLDERDAEAICGALALAICITTKGKAGAALQLGIGGPDVAQVIVFKDTTNLGCAIAEFYGLPCPEHHGKKASKDQCAHAKAEALERATRLAEQLLDFSRSYRDEKIEAFSPDEQGGDWMPDHFKN